MNGVLTWLFDVRAGRIADWKIEAVAPLPLWLIFMVILPAVISYSWYVYRREQGFLTTGKRAFLAGLRILAFGALLMILMEPVLSIDLHYPVRGTVLVLIDDSLSMGVKDDRYTPSETKEIAKLAQTPEDRVAGLSRIDIVNALLKNKELDLIKRLAQDSQEIQVFTFSSGLAKQKGEVAAKGTVTRLGDALLEALREAHDRQVTAIVMITDGRSNAGAPVKFVARSLSQLDPKIPVYTIGVGVDLPAKDIRMVRASAEPVVLINDDVNVEFDVEQSGFDGLKVAIQLTGDGGTIAAREIELKPGRTTGTLKFKAERAGEFRYVVTAAPQKDELSRDNNSQPVNLIVVDKKVKVLYVEGRARNEYVFLKSSLIRDDKLLAWCYLVDADPRFPQEVSLELKDDPGLKRFPADRKELEKYDVVVFGDVDVRQLGEPKRPGDPVTDWRTIADNLAWFVEDLGGAVIFVAGSESNPWSYRDTPVARLLPVVIPAGNPLAGRIFRDAFHPKMTAQGKAEPILRLKEDSDQNQKYWEDNDGLPPLYWFAPIKESKPAAKVLLRHPDGSVLLATQISGRGRTMYLGTDEVWRWREYLRDKVYYKFWGQAIQRMRAGKLLRNKRFSLFVKPVHNVNDRVEIEAQVFDETLRPAVDPALRAQCDGPSGEKWEIELQAVPGRPGAYRGVFTPEKEGQYRLWLGPPGHVDQGTLETFTARAPVLEFENTSLDTETLKMLSSETGGAYYGVADTAKMLNDLRLKPPQVVSKERRETELWDTPLAFVLFVTLLVIEWALRRRWGLA